jgi:ABC-type multidrug transport system ATPase subunit
MQLFALIAKVDSVNHDGRSVVKAFLKQQLSVDQVNNYLILFESYLEKHQKLSKEGDRKKKRTSVNSVKVLVICTEINSELTQNQKMVVLLRLLEFVYSDKEIGEQEVEFVETVASTFNIPDQEFKECMAFVKADSTDIPDAPNYLLVSSNKFEVSAERKHIFAESLPAPILILQIQSTGMYVVRYLGNVAMYLNGQVIEQNRVYFLTHGSSLRNQKVLPIYYSDITSKFRSNNSAQSIHFTVDNVVFQFNAKQYGLHHLNLTEESGHLIGIMGASGAGKSTLLNVLNGSTAPTSGSVKINGINIYTEKEKLEGVIGYISQDDLLLEDLTVFQNLYFNTKLCYDKLLEHEIIKKVADLLKTIGLYEIRDLKVGNPLNKKISGGQRKRLNIALELIREPQVLFVDEPTSGLSSRDSENIMDLLKELALKGKLVFVVIHQPSSDIFKMFDNLFILDTGGYPIYYGNPVDAVIYFKTAINHVNCNESECHECGNVNPEQIFNIIETKVVDEYGNITPTRKVSAKQWNDYYIEHLAEIQAEKVAKERDQVKEVPGGVYKIPSKISQFKVFFVRDILSKLANTQYMLINFLEAPLLAVILSYMVKFYSTESGPDSEYIFRYNENLTAYLFMSVVVALFLGLTVSAEEIIRDQKILKRESFLNLSRSSYLISKVSIMFIISAIQTFTYVIIGNTILDIQGLTTDYWLVLFVTSCFANMLGLNISSAFDSVVTIYILIPIILIPQLLLSGVIVKFDKLNPTLSSQSMVPMTGEMMTSRWAFEALAVNQFKENAYEKEFYPIDKAMSHASYKKNYWIPELQTKLNACIKNIDNSDKAFEVAKDWKLICHEIKKENTEIAKAQVFELTAPILAAKLTIDGANKAIAYLNELNIIYISVYNENSKTKSSNIDAKNADKAKKDVYLAFRNQFQNENLGDLVKNNAEINKIIEHEGQLIQKSDPVYREASTFRAHFFAPVKHIFGFPVDTFWANIFTIVCMGIFLYFTLYFDLFRKVIEGIARIASFVNNLK